MIRFSDHSKHVYAYDATGKKLRAEYHTPIQPYKYNGKELDHHHGLDWYDYGARWYNGYSWTTPDPLAENYREVSPYMYCLGNPIKYIDPDGREIWIHYINADGNSESFLYSPGMTCTTDFDSSLGGPTYRRLGYSRGEIKQNPLIKNFLPAKNCEMLACCQ